MPPLRVYESPTGDGGLTFATSAGVAAFDAAGALVGVDVIDSLGRLTPAAASERWLVTVESRLTLPGVPGPAHVMHVLDRESGKLVSSTPLVLFGAVKEIELIEGVALVHAGDAVVAYAMPVE
jgi:hypothetical protein